MKQFTKYFIILALVLALVGVPLIPAFAATTYPTFSIVSVVTDTSVTIQTNNLPAKDSFDVLMNVIGTKGIGGTKVATQDSGTGGTQTYTYNIPAELKGKYQIAIRMQSNTGSGYYAYNWFYNSSSAAAPTATPVKPGPTATPTATPVAGSTYTGYPSFTITGVVKDGTVTILTKNLPTNVDFDVLMNKIGTMGVNGVKVATQASGTGGAQTFTYNIPDSLKGQTQIAIRLQSASGVGYYAYNWFYNSNHP